MKQSRIKSFVTSGLAMILCFTFIFSITSTAYASTYDDLKAIEDEIEKSKGNAAAEEKYAKLLIQQIEELDQDIINTNAVIDQNESQKAIIEAKLVSAQSELDKAVADSIYYKKMLDERLAVMYMYGNSGYLEVLFGSTSFSDFIDRINIVSSIISYDRDIAEKLKQAEQTIRTKKDEIALEKTKLDTIISDLKTQNATIESKKAEKDAALTKAESNAAYWNERAAQEESAAKELRMIMAAANANGAYGNDFKTLSWPTPGYTYITDYFGYRIHPISGTWRMHNGVDIGVPYGVPIVAPGNGKVLFADYKYSYGNTVILDLGKDENNNHFKMVFAHASSIAVSAGDIVTEGQILSYVGSTGDSTGPHLHFELLINDEYQNALDYVIPK